MSSPRIALTGATGFLGRHVVARLVADHDLVCISRGGSAPDGHTGLSVDIAGERDPTDGLVQAFDGCSVVVHAAGRVSHAQADAQALWDVHVTGTERVMAAARRAGVKRVVHISTSGTIAVDNKPTDHAEARVEADGGAGILQWIGRWPYYRSKWVAEDAALSAAGPDLDVICLNPGLLLGPGDDPNGEATKAVRVFLDDGMSVVPAGGPCFVDVRDVAEAVRASLVKGRSGVRYLLGGANMPWWQLYGALARLSGRQEPIFQSPSRLTTLIARSFPELVDGRDGVGGLPLSSEELELASRYWYANWHRATIELGFAPRDPMDTLEDTVADILEQRRRGWQLYGRHRELTG